MLSNSILKEQAVADLDFMLMATSAVTSAYHWRMRRMPESIRSTDPFGNGAMLEDWLLPTYSCQKGFKEILGSDMNLRFAGRDISHALLILIHSQLLSRPLENFFATKVEGSYPDSQVPRRAIAAMLQHSTEQYVEDWLNGELPENNELPIMSMTIPSRDMLLEISDDDLPQLAEALAETKQAMQRLLSEPQIQGLLQQTYTHMQILGYEQQDYAEDPLHIRNGEPIVGLLELMQQTEPLQSAIAKPVEERSTAENALELRLIASSIRQIYGEPIESKDASLMPPNRPGFGCGRLLNRTITNMDYPGMASQPDPAVKPSYVAHRLDILADKMAAHSDWRRAAESLGTVDRAGGRSLERHLQTMRPLEWATMLLEHATATATPPLDSDATHYLSDLQDALKGTGKIQAQQRGVA